MSRRNAPRLIDPRDQMDAGMRRQLGIIEPADLLARIETLEREFARMRDEAARRLPIELPYERISYATPEILRTVNVKGSTTATNITGTTTVTNSNLGPLLLGIPYLVIAFAQMGMNAPAGQTIYAAIRIEAGGTTTDGTQTQITAGERDGFAIDYKVVQGTGASINIAGRARVTSGTGTVTDCISTGIAIPLGAMVQR